MVVAVARVDPGAGAALVVVCVCVVEVAVCVGGPVLVGGVELPVGFAGDVGKVGVDVGVVGDVVLARRLATIHGVVMSIGFPDWMAPVTARTAAEPVPPTAVASTVGLRGKSGHPPGALAGPVGSARNPAPNAYGFAYGKLRSMGELFSRPRL